MNEEKNLIVEISAKFACFLDKNSITTFNDAVKGHLDYLINENEKLGETKKVEDLKQTLKDYEEKKNIIEKSIKDSDKKSEIITLEEVGELKQKLFGLEINGKMFVDICANLEKIKEEYRYREVAVQPISRTKKM